MKDLTKIAINKETSKLIDLDSVKIGENPPSNLTRGNYFRPKTNAEAYLGISFGFIAQTACFLYPIIEKYI